MQTAQARNVSGNMGWHDTPHPFKVGIRGSNPLGGMPASFQDIRLDLRHMRRTGPDIATS